MSTDGGATPVHPGYLGDPVPTPRSRGTTHGRNAAGARALWRATGLGDATSGGPGSAELQGLAAQ